MKLKLRPGFLLGKIITSFNRIEKILLLIFLLATISACAFMYRQNWLENTVPQAVAGGIYTEGLVASSLTDVTPAINKLTKVGLTKLDETGQITPALAKSWEVTDEGKTYTFLLNELAQEEDVKKALEENTQLFPDIDFELVDNKIIFRLEQPFSPFLATTTEPIFTYGPYKISEEKKGEISFEPRDNSIADKPFLKKIVIRVYLDSFHLTQALADGEIDGVADVNDIENPLLVESLNMWEIDLPRRLFLFFNTDQELLKNTEIRQKLKNKEKLDEPVDLTLSILANPHQEELASEIVDSWKKLGVNIKVESFTATELATEIVPKRAYQLLIYGLDFGGDPDPYPFWHSSQIGEEGLNLSNFANIDSDRILEKARQSSDTNERVELYRQFQDIFDKEVPAIMLEQVTAIFGTSPNIQGVRSVYGLSVADRYKFVSEWYKDTIRVPIEK